MRSSFFIPERDILDKKVREAVEHFWRTRLQQKNSSSGQKGNRGAVTGGKQLDGFVHLIKEILLENGLKEEEIHVRSGLTLPGYYRPTKDWDLVVVKEENKKKQLLAAIELKSQVGSFGKNFNNRTEESLGSSTDLWKAYEKNAFGSKKPFLGYLMLLEDTEAAHKKRRVYEPNFEVFEEFKRSSYAERYKILCKKLVLERKYTSACLLTSNREDGMNGAFNEPSKDVNIYKFIKSLVVNIISNI
ncbi:PaeR7I family type II restriction endonuclease [Natroniella acetigena]|uniref:PaeR7I family type II restriction endonuclease n=1 Tax=Natroniella acetigena TaxID=52004 RepID=UPI00200B6C69|nr:PaeR7I family type II restriction endonuclease [Natroniella acetigena]MCK8828575.1 PaeR7I family type II restriction endonuclease [Natroniella acetigena]